ncbi:hypothetical protein CFR78_07155 [Komagataeibacter rhaeticus]|uniref:DUF1491 family protein n=1 Tax=Komagataeibacter rhaeticus TaxID=215221 RepID=UPI0004DAED83|nr:DUF1491 family protein [Komagataeibacter rhaeticus]KDU97116.1 hypothetical protein GLUCORHAEAF1_17220 [Komagataeibacter rhaeticus AF1]MBL7240448.1 DUF1491 family protein [Komagataeibacter rhaeticus]PYD53744.1 hypothetical protein CFR78_07155 [Komagataeibacter rhaeticus]GBQ10437.1 hypothetical protein AA16663_0497 [Komagataeibacter rhaeticus DSM 16663]
MEDARLKTGIWVKAMLRQAGQTGNPGMILHRGDADAGGVVIVLLGRGGHMCVLAQTRTPDGRRAWFRATGEAAVDQASVDAYVTRQMERDPDLWVLEFDAPDLVPPFEARLI